MNPRSDEDFKSQEKKLQAEIYPPTLRQVWGSRSPAQLRSWFSSLSKPGKIVAGVVVAMIAVTLVQIVLKLVAAVISVALLAGLVYFGYKLFLSSPEHKV
jgi:hypothetical protein